MTASLGERRGIEGADQLLNALQWRKTRHAKPPAGSNTPRKLARQRAWSMHSMLHSCGIQSVTTQSSTSVGPYTEENLREENANQKHIQYRTY